MFERFTQPAIKVIMLAQEEARRLGHNFVGSEQILLGLIGEGASVGAKALKSAGVNLKDARTETEKIIGRGSGFVAVEIPFTPRSKRILEHSWNEARRIQHNYIGTEHLLLGLLIEGDGVAMRVLENLGVRTDSMYRHIHSMLGTEPGDLFAQTSDARANWYDIDSPKGIGEVLKYAEEHAREMSKPEIDVDDIFIGLIQAEKCVSSRALREQGLSFDAVKKFVDKRSPGHGTGSPPGVMPLSNAADLWLKRAAHLSSRQVQRATTGLLLLDLIDPQRARLASMLTELGVDFDELTAEIMAIHGGKGILPDEEDKK